MNILWLREYKGYTGLTHSRLFSFFSSFFSLPSPYRKVGTWPSWFSPGIFNFLTQMNENPLQEDTGPSQAADGAQKPQPGTDSEPEV
jgi:hypothetical protein